MVQAQRTSVHPSKHMLAERARCVELCPISSGWFKHIEPLKIGKGVEGGISRIFTKRGSIESYSSADYSAAHESALFLTDRELYNFEFRAPFRTAHA